MRIFTFLFSFYLVALSVLPCSDAFTGGQNGKNEITFSASHEHSANNDFCSPFCICNCCSTPVISKFKSLITPITKSTVVSQLQFPLRELSVISKYTGIIWNPPQIIA